MSSERIASDRIVVSREEDEIREVLDGLLEEDYPGLVAKATPERLAELAERHVLLYQRRLDSGSPAVNVEETERLLGVWREVRSKETFEALSDSARLEVLDALAAEGA